MVRFETPQNILIFGFYEEKMKLIESGIQLASINPSVKFVPSYPEHQLRLIFLCVIWGLVVVMTIMSRYFCHTTTQISLQLVMAFSLVFTNVLIMLFHWSKQCRLFLQYLLHVMHKLVNIGYKQLKRKEYDTESLTTWVQREYYTTESLLMAYS